MNAQTPRRHRAAGATDKVSIRDLKFFYGDTLALKGDLAAARRPTR